MLQGATTRFVGLTGTGPSVDVAGPPKSGPGPSRAKVSPSSQLAERWA